MADKLTLNVAVDPAKAALVFIDMQNHAAHRQGRDFKGLPLDPLEEYGYYFRRFDTPTRPKLPRLQSTARQAGTEVMCAVIKSFTQDRRVRCTAEQQETFLRAIRGYRRQMDTQAMAPVLATAR